MEFRTEIKIEPFGQRIGYGERLLFAGSCFADELCGRMARLKFRAAGNFGGVLFNPRSIAATLRRAAAGTEVTASELHRSDCGTWFHYGVATHLDGADATEVLGRVNGAFAAWRRALEEADLVVATFGTAWIYRLRTTGETVANCHRQPQGLFLRERLTVEEIVDEWSELLVGPLAGKRVILTVSPVRHLGDGLEGNAVSKAVLRLAADCLARRFDTVRYFPAYEILMDDLRDYRFYADDLAHPSKAAVDYVWERFAEAALDARTRALLPRVGRLVAAARHRPLDARSAAHAAHCARMADEARLLARETGLDFSEEITLFETGLSR